MGRELYFVESGELEVFRRAGGREHVLVLVEPGQTVGELAFLDPAPRSASVRAKTECELLVLSADDLAGSADRDILLDLSRAIAVQTITRLRDNTDARIASQEEALRASRKQTQFGQLFGYVMLSFGIGTIMNAMIDEGLLPFDVHTRGFSWFT